LRACLATPVRRTLGQQRAFDLLFLAYWPVRNLFVRQPTARRVAVLSMWDQAQADLAQITAPNKAAYCQRRGYAWLPCTSGFDPSRPVAWSKLLFLQRHLPDYEWIMWSDADSLITNPAIKIESLIRTKADLVITMDKVGFNSGSFLIRNSSWSLAFLAEAWSLPAQPAALHGFDIWSDRLWENRAFVQLLLAFRHRRHTQVLPQRRLNSYLADTQRPDENADHQPGDFVLHLPGTAHEKRLSVLSKYASRLTQH